MERKKQERLFVFTPTARAEVLFTPYSAFSTSLSGVEPDFMYLACLLCVLRYFNHVLS